MTSAGGKLLEGVQLFDVYRDEERIGAGKKSMAYCSPIVRRTVRLQARKWTRLTSPGEEGLNAAGAE